MSAWLAATLTETGDTIANIRTPARAGEVTVLQFGPMPSPVR